MSIFYQAPGFDSERVAHGFFGRRGGVSTGVYESLNAGYSTDDPKVSENRDIIARTMGSVGRDNIATVHQIHSAECVYVTASVPLDQRPQVDAMVTDQPNVILGVLSADCGPILFRAVNKKGDPLIGAAHAGWRGAFGGVLENTVRCMTDHGAQLGSIVAVAGPCIAQKSYEVSQDFLEPFLRYDPDDARFFKVVHGSDKYLFDLPGYIARRLAACGVRRVILSDIDTYTNAQDYFSYRRGTHTKNGENGRQMSCIKILN